MGDRATEMQSTRMQARSFQEVTEGIFTRLMLMRCLLRAGPAVAPSQTCPHGHLEEGGGEAGARGEQGAARGCTASSCRGGTCTRVPCPWSTFRRQKCKTGLPVLKEFIMHLKG